jgi:hypothetical protein
VSVTTLSFVSTLIWRLHQIVGDECAFDAVVIPASDCAHPTAWRA